ncbi:MAG: hypothetical protein ABIH46_06550 [Chloroflexota bacterium]
MIQDAVEKEYKNLLEVFEVETPNDVENLRTLATLNVTRRSLQQDIVTTLEHSADTSDLARQLSAISKEARNIEVALGIDVKTRSRMDESERADEILFDLIERSKEFRAKHIKHIQHCGILLGFTCMHFPAHTPRTLTMKCPRCGEIFDAELVSDIDLEEYGEAGDFMPTGVQPGVLTG